MPATVVSFGYLDTDNSKMNGVADGATNLEIIRKISEDLSRKRLTDVEEGDENGEDVDAGLTILTPRRNTSHRDRKSSSASNTSIVLTEDTDSFIIGQRVWVGGTKPGLIAYIGDTQFAPGEWAGIVLDEPIGKNDGSVAGTRYFQCEPRRGVFSRLTRLTRAPLPQAYADVEPSPVARNSVSGSAAKPPHGGGSSPTGSSYSNTNSLKRSAGSLTTSNTSLASTPHTDLKIGERVIVRSSATTGSKAGILRFLGPTEFAPGEWCGVELDDPIGKNDGSVDGIRYFDCQSFYGLFAPVAKVSRSPSTRRPAGCVVHRTGMRRTGSRESLNSTTTSVASSVRTAASSRVRLGVNSLKTPSSSVLKKSSPPKSYATPLTTKTTLQDALRDKEAQVSKLLKERELERAEVTRAASQADHAEQILASLTKEYEQFRKECEIRLKEKDGAICKIQSDRDNLVSLLDEEKRRGEDLQFKFEEAAINKVDVEVVNDTHVERIKELESLLSEERKKVEAHENESNKLFEAEEAYGRTKEQLESLQEQVKSMHSSDEMVSSLQKQLDEYKNKLQDSEKKQKELEQVYETDMLKLKTQSDEKHQSQSTELNTVVEQYKKEIHSLKQQLSETQEEKKKTDAIVQKQMDEMSALRVRADQQNLALQQKTKDVCDNAVKTEDKLQREVEKLKMELSGKAFDVEAIVEKMKKKDMLVNELQVKLDAALSELKSKDEDIEKHVRRKRETEEEHRKHIEDMKSTLQATTDSFEDHKIAAAQELMAKHHELSEAHKKLSDGNSVITKLEFELGETKAVVTKSAVSIREYEQQLKYLKEKDDKILELNSMYESTCHRLAECHDYNTKQELDIHQKDAQIEAYRKDFEILYVKLKKEEDSNCNLTAKINEMELEIGDLTRKIASMEETTVVLTQQKQKLEVEIQGLLSTAYDSNDKITKLNDDLRDKERELEAFRGEMNVKQLNCERDTQELQQAVVNLNMQRNLEKEQNEKKIADLNDTNRKLQDQLVDVAENARKSADRLNSEMKDLSNICETKEAEMKHELDMRGQAEANLRMQIDALLVDKENDIKKFSEKIQQLENDKNQLQNTLKDKNDMVIELQTKCQRAQSDAKAKEAEMTSYFNNEVKQLQEDIEDLQRRIAEKDTIINELNMHINICKQDNFAINDSIKDQVKMLEGMKMELMKAQNDYKHLQQELGEKTAMIATLMNQVDMLEKGKSNCESKNADLENKLREIEEYLNTLNKDKRFTEDLSAEKDKEIMSLKNELEHLTKNLCKPLEAEITDLTWKFQQAQNELLGLKQNLEDKDKMEMTLRNELEKVKQEKCEKYEDSLIQLFNLQQECDMLMKREQDANLLKDEEIENLKIQLALTKEGQDKAAEDKYKQLEKQYEDALIEKDLVQKECIQVENQVMILNKTLDKVKNDNRIQLEEKIALIEKLCDQYKAESEGLQNELNNKGAIIENLEANINVCIQEHNKDLEALRNEIGQKNEALVLCKTKQNTEWLQLMAQLEQKEKEIVFNDAPEKCKQVSVEIRQPTDELIVKNKIICNRKNNDATTTATAPCALAVSHDDSTSSDCDNYKDQISKMKPYVESTIKLTTELHREKLYVMELEKKLQKLAEENKELMMKMQDFLTRILSNTHKKGDLKQCVKEKDALMCQIKELQAEMQKLVEEIDVCRSQQLPISIDDSVLIPSEHNLNEKFKRITDSKDMVMMNGNIALQMEQLQEAQGQIEFLNSIIADMQQKNTALRNKVEELEATSCSSDAYEISIRGIIQPRPAAPRMFCDICDSFDLHETEDCPHQSNDSPPPQLKVINHHLPQDRSERPYCEICEVFGHSTENCDDTETY